MIIPKISVITPAYNQEKYIARCLRSLINQSIDKTEFEIILVDEGAMIILISDESFFKSF